jgi:hypothetical protein
MRVIRHQTAPCPACHAQRFCDDCGICDACKFAPPLVDLPHSPPPAPALRCDECGHAVLHARTCSVTLATLRS